MQSQRSASPPNECSSLVPRHQCTRAPHERWLVVSSCVNPVAAPVQVTNPAAGPVVATTSTSTSECSNGTRTVRAAAILPTLIRSKRNCRPGGLKKVTVSAPPSGQPSLLNLPSLSVTTLRARMPMVSPAPGGISSGTHSGLTGVLCVMSASRQLGIGCPESPTKRPRRTTPRDSIVDSQALPFCFHRRAEMGIAEAGCLACTTTTTARCGKCAGSFAAKFPFRSVTVNRLPCTGEATSFVTGHATQIVAWAKGAPSAPYTIPLRARLRTKVSCNACFGGSLRTRGNPTANREECVAVTCAGNAKPDVEIAVVPELSVVPERWTGEPSEGRLAARTISTPCTACPVPARVA